MVTMTHDIEQQRRFIASGTMRERAARDRTLAALADAIKRREEPLLAALADDVGKPAVEAYASELGFVLRDIEYARRHLGDWMKGRPARVPLMLRPAKAQSLPEALGVVLIIGTWNYPFQLLMSPCVAALSAGNAVVLKPSEYAPATAREIEALCREVFDDRLVRVVQGGADVASALTGQRFDHIFYTGSARAGRDVAIRAAQNLVPVTLELGGKSPCVVSSSADLDVAARRILWGKSMNAGQTCVAPDYVLVDAGVESAFLDSLKRAWNSFYPDGVLKADYGRIVNRHHFERLRRYLGDGTVVVGGGVHVERLMIEPTILTGVGDDAPVMQQEIFGPILPVLPVRDVDAAIRFINDRPSPLAAYFFDKNRRAADRFVREVRAGTVCVNDTISQILPADLPFGGVGPSGWGRYRGQAGFLTFSNLKAVMHRPLSPDPRFRYPPTTISLTMLKKAFRWMMR